ncbi:MAG: F0F1 ATP synthase subunit epsilon [Anaerolineae bacterium]
MFAPWHLVVLTPVETLLETSGVQWIQVRLADGGEIGIWPGHAPLLAETVTAPLRYADDTGEHRISIQAGILHITPGEVFIYTTGLADDATATTAEFGEGKPLGKLMGTFRSPQASQG